MYIATELCILSVMEEYDPFCPAEEDVESSSRFTDPKAILRSEETVLHEDSDDDEDDNGSEEEDDDDENDDEELEEEAEASSSDESADRCPVCLCRFKGQDVGTPESCDHTFCLECIQEWAKNVNTCPADRTVFHLIMARHDLNGEIFNRIPVEDKNTMKDLDDEFEDPDEDMTLCEVCGRGDREDRLLLCDGCDHGYHLECLTPPLCVVPVAEWFCARCAERNHTAESSQTRSSFQRQIARTLVSERVRAHLQESRLRQTRSGRLMLESDDDDETGFVTAADVAAVSATTRRTRSPISSTRKITKSRRRIKRKRPAGKRRSKKRGRRVSKRLSKASSSSMKALITPKTRIARNLGLVQPKRGRSIPEVKPKSEKGGTIDLPGFTPLSIMGNKDELIEFDDGSDEEPRKFVKNSISCYSALARLSNKPICFPSLGGSERKPVNVTQPATSTTSCDLLGSILLGQDLLHKDAKQVTIQRDGSLHVRQPTPPLATRPVTPIDENKTIRFGDHDSKPGSSLTSVMKDSKLGHKQLNAPQHMLGGYGCESTPQDVDGSDESDADGGSDDVEHHESREHVEGSDGDDIDEGEVGDAGGGGDEEEDDGEKRGNDNNEDEEDEEQDDEEQEDEEQEDDEKEDDVDQADEEDSPLCEENALVGGEIERSDDVVEDVHGEIDDRAEVGEEAHSEAMEQTHDNNGCAEEAEQMTDEEEPGELGVEDRVGAVTGIMDDFVQENGNDEEECVEEAEESMIDDVEDSVADYDTDEHVGESKTIVEDGNGEDVQDRDDQVIDLQQYVAGEDLEAVEVKADSIYEQKVVEEDQDVIEHADAVEGKQENDGEDLQSVYEETETVEERDFPEKEQKIFEEEVAAADETVEEVQDEVEELEGEVGELVGGIEDLEHVVEGIEAGVDAEEAGEDGEVNEREGTPGLEEDEAGRTPNLEEDEEGEHRTPEQYPQLFGDSRIVQERTPVKGHHQPPSNDTMVLYDDGEDQDVETLEEYAPKLPVSELPRIPKLNRNRLQIEIRNEGEDTRENEDGRRRRRYRGEKEEGGDRDDRHRRRDRHSRFDDEEDKDRGRKRSSSRDRMGKRSRSRDKSRRSRSRDHGKRRHRDRDHEDSYERHRSPDHRRRKRDRDEPRSSSRKRDKDEFGRDLSSRDRYNRDGKEYVSGSKDTDYYEVDSGRKADDDLSHRKRSKRDDFCDASFQDDHCSEDKYRKSYDRGDKYGRDRDDKRSKDRYSKEGKFSGEKYWGTGHDDRSSNEPLHPQYNQTIAPEPLHIIPTVSTHSTEADNQSVDMDLTYDPADPTDDVTPSPPIDALVMDEDPSRESVLVNVPMQLPPFMPKDPPPDFKPNEPPPQISLWQGLPPGINPPAGGPPPGPPAPPGGPLQGELLRHQVHLVGAQSVPCLPGLPQNIGQGLVLNPMLLNPLNRLPIIAGMAGMQLPPGMQHLQNRMMAPGLGLAHGARVPFEPGMDHVRLLSRSGVDLGQRMPASIALMNIPDTPKESSPQIPPPEFLRNMPPPRLPMRMQQNLLRHPKANSPEGPPPPPPPPPKMHTQQLPAQIPQENSPKKSQPDHTLDSIATLQRIKTLGSLLNTQIAMASLATMRPSDDGDGESFKTPLPPKKVEFKIPPPPRLAKEDKPAEIVEPVEMDMSSPTMDIDDSPPALDVVESEVNEEKSEKKGKENKDESPKKKKESRRDKESPRKKELKEKKKESSKKKDDFDELVGAVEKKRESKGSAGPPALSDNFIKKMNRQERIIEEVKQAIKPHYAAKKITKEEYKDILRKSVPKICNSKSGDINPAKIRSFVEVYVSKIHQRKKRSGEVTSTSPSSMDTAIAKYAIPDRIKEKMKTKGVEKARKGETVGGKKHKDKKKKH